MLERIIDFFRPYMADWGYLIVGVATFLENSIGAGVIVPGETLVIIGGFYARQGALSLVGVTLVALVGAILGDNTGYLLGRRYGRGLLDRHGPKLFISPERVAAADRFYRRHGGKTVFLARFIPFVRSVGFVIAGVSRMPWGRFAVWDAAGAALWAVLHTLLGYAIGASYERWKGYLTPAGLGVLALLLALILGSKWLAARRRAREEARRAREEARP